MAAKKKATAARKPRKESGGFTAEEREAMRERARETKKSGKVDGEQDLLAKLKAMPAADRALGERIHAIVKANAPQLTSRTWYGMPAYANADGKVVCFFQAADKFKARYATLGFSDEANLDDGDVWPTAFAVKALNAAEEAKIAALVKKAVR